MPRCVDDLECPSAAAILKQKRIGESMNSNLTRWTRLKLAVQSLRRFLTPTTEAWSVATWLMLAALLYPQIMGQTLRIEALNSAAPSEIVLRRYQYPLKDFAAANP